MAEVLKLPMSRCCPGAAGGSPCVHGRPQRVIEKPVRAAELRSIVAELLAAAEKSAASANRALHVQIESTDCGRDSDLKRLTRRRPNLQRTDAHVLGHVTVHKCTEPRKCCGYAANRTLPGSHASSR